MPFRKFYSIRDHSNFLKKRGSFASNKRKKRAFRELAFQTRLLGLPPNAANDSRGDKRWVMRFILRMAFWLTVILVLLPSGGSQPTPKVNVSASDAVSAAGATVPT